MSNNIFVPMVPVNGVLGGEIHAEGRVIKPDANGIFWIPAQHVVALLSAGFTWPALQNANPHSPE